METCANRSQWKVISCEPQSLSFVQTQLALMQPTIYDCFSYTSLHTVDALIADLRVTTVSLFFYLHQKVENNPIFQFARNIWLFPEELFPHWTIFCLFPLKREDNSKCTHLKSFITAIPDTQRYSSAPSICLRTSSSLITVTSTTPTSPSFDVFKESGRSTGSATKQAYLLGKNF